jgi:uncharacterized membrane protein YdjX (TVP38/TMEM64 family)
MDIGYKFISLTELGYLFCLGENYSSRRKLGGNMRVSQFWFKIALTAITILLGFGIYYKDPEFFPRLFALSVRGDLQGTIEYLQSFGTKAAWISFLLLIILNVLGFLPNIFLLVANGYLFGLVPGILISWAGECAGAALGFFIMRRLYQDSARALLVRSGYEEKIEAFSSEKGFGLILAGRALPYMPSGVLTAVGAISTVSFQDFIIATCIGKIPSVTIEVLSGHDVITFHQHLPRLIGLAMLSLLIVWGYLHYVKRVNRL